MSSVGFERDVVANTKTTSERRIVSYFDHEFLSLSLARAERDIQTIVEKGFTHVVLCITETDMMSPERQAYLLDVVDILEAHGIVVLADPWAVGGVRGGEGISHFVLSGERSCICNPKLETLDNHWFDLAQLLRIEIVFLDEPEMKCDEHRNDELRYIEQFTAEASRRGLENVVCLCANEHKKDQLREVAAMDMVAEIATDPYDPNVFLRKGEIRTSRQQRVKNWAEYTETVATEWGKRSHTWVQLFDIPEDQPELPREHLAIVRQAMTDVAIWGYNGCASVPNFAKQGYVEPQTAWQDFQLTSSNLLPSHS